MPLVPVSKTCFLCGQDFLAEWAQTKDVRAWHTSEICPRCEAKLREKAA